MVEQASILPLKLEGATLRKRGKTLVGPIDLTLASGGVTLVIGPNGAGKTSLLRLMHGLDHPRAGTRDWSVAPNDASRRQAYVFQFPILMRRTVIDNLCYPLRLRGQSRNQAYKIAEGWLERVGLIELAKARATILSGGEQQKLALARALITEPELLFLDEPCANLDGASIREIEALIVEARQRGTTVVLTTHDLGQAKRLADHVLFVYNGQIIEQGPADQFFAGPKTDQARAYLVGDIVE